MELECFDVYIVLHPMSIEVPSQSQIYGLILPCSQRGDYGVSSLNSNGFDGNKLTPEQL